MSLTSEDIGNVAHLARLHLDPDSQEKLGKNLAEILGMVDQIESAPTQGVEPMAHPSDVSQRLRVDRVTESDQREHFQAVAPMVSDGHYLVPKVID